MAKSLHLRTVHQRFVKRAVRTDARTERNMNVDAANHVFCGSKRVACSQHGCLHSCGVVIRAVAHKVRCHRSKYLVDPKVSSCFFLRHHLCACARPAANSHSVHRLCGVRSGCDQRLRGKSAHCARDGESTPSRGDWSARRGHGLGVAGVSE